MDRCHCQSCMWPVEVAIVSLLSSPWPIRFDHLDPPGPSSLLIRPLHPFCWYTLLNLRQYHLSDPIMPTRAAITMRYMQPSAAKQCRITYKIIAIKIPINCALCTHNSNPTSSANSKGTIAYPTGLYWSTRTSNNYQHCTFQE